MKILVVCQYYYPEPFRIPDICEALAARGHEVTVVTGVPNYPMGKIYPGYEHAQRRREMLRGVDVRRCFTIARRSGALFRLLNYYSFAFSSARYAKTLPDTYDVVFVNQLSPVMMASAGIAYKKKFGKKLVLYCLDLWPESLTVGGVSRESILFRFFRKESEKVYRQADRILVSSESFRDYFAREFGIQGAEHLPQYAEELFSPEQCRKISDGFLDLTFAGNIGTAQSVDTILRAASLTKEEIKLRWHIVGDGIELSRLEAYAEEHGLKNVFFYGRKPLEEMPEYYRRADAMLVTMQKDDALSLTLPGKVQTYMAAGKPILGAINGAAKSVIEESGCGRCAGAEDAEGLAATARELLQHPEELEIYGQKSRLWYEEHYSKERFLAHLERCLSESCKQ